MDLILVESPTKARKLKDFLAGKYDVEATMGHIRDLPESKIGVEVNSKVKMHYEVMKDKEARVKELISKATKAKHVILATDPDREGEAIAWHMSELILEKSKAKNAKEKLSRIAFHEITKNAVSNALLNPRKIDMNLVDAQQARRALDRLVGYKLSPLLWRKIRRGLSAGRVQSVAVRLVVEKEREIEKHIAVEYWVIGVTLKKLGKTKEIFQAELTSLLGQKLKVDNSAQAETVVKDLEVAVYKVEQVDQKEVTRSPQAPFTTSTLQQVAANKLGWTAKKTMQMAQGLYEEGFITYHRTDSTNISAEAIKAVNEKIGKKYGDRYQLAQPRVFKTKSKVAQEAHEAIRPTDLDVEGVNHEGMRLYELIWKRFVASQMSEVLVDQTKVEISAKAGEKVYGLEAKGEVIKFDGWMILYGGKKKNAEDEEENADKQVLPDLLVGDRLEKDKVNSEQKFTQPPARYNDASLIKKLEELEIGRPSTYAPTLSTIIDRRYVERDQRRFKPTVLGIAVNDFLVTNFAEIVDFQFTAKMEDALDEVANGDKKWQEEIVEFYKPFEKKLEKVGETAKRVAVETEKTGNKCPKCSEGEEVIRLGRFGKFLSCSRFPECDYKANYVLKVDGVKCPKDGGEVVVRKSRKGKTFFGCNNWPKCDFASWTKPEVAAPASV